MLRLANPAREPGLIKPALLWLLLLAPLFFGTYGFATWFTTQRDDVGTLVFSWENHMPFWGWSIVPYWSIDLLYGLSLLLPDSRQELKRHALRLLTAQLVAVSCFLIWPLRFTFARPEMDGVFGWMFDVLAGFDKPFNQAPSLHIALLVVLWSCYQRHLQGVWRVLMHGWFALIGISVLTTYQHHFIDLPTGALLGWLCVWLWPLEGPSPLHGARLTTEKKRWRLALYYLLGAIACVIPAFAGKGAWLWLLWPAVALLLVALNYAVLDVGGFQKRADGRLSAAARWLLAPYLIAARLNSRLWTRKDPDPDLVLDNVWLGRIPTPQELEDSTFTAVVDLCAELSLNPGCIAYRSLPVLDLTAPGTALIGEAALAIESLRQQGPLLVCCALGYSRSATAVAAWLLHTGRAASVEEAVALIQLARPGIVLGARHRQVLEQLSQTREVSRVH
ncbi:serine/threonine protein phosphatase [Pseudomonas sp. Leaf48]|jgi:protein-tyrosine phosphatase|uniref:phosphatase PAP2/dual specificity phosphatase family protein n=1 Tax=Pseudomonas sp. Leaf48 TaxID=1736221 RepID=UPI000728BDC3|nr:phosphatase PAP2/dual specificity phosphatase family protein [Pseudomonas sp. Leaf48]KQN54651.1 serine/threonine protein phosphatase [Pseudomonas sp. Leaf48]